MIPKDREKQIQHLADRIKIDLEEGMFYFQLVNLFESEFFTAKSPEEIIKRFQQMNSTGSPLLNALAEYISTINEKEKSEEVEAWMRNGVFKHLMEYIDPLLKRKTKGGVK